MVRFTGATIEWNNKDTPMIEIAAHVRACFTTGVIHAAVAHTT